MRFNISYQPNPYTIHYQDIPNSFSSIVFCLICFNTSLENNYTNVSTSTTEIGNIETFLVNDTFYPFTAIGSRYSYIHPQKYVSNQTNCIRVPVSSYQTGNIVVDVNISSLGDPWIAFLTNNGIVRGPKEGTVATQTPPETLDVHRITPVKALIQNITSRWNANQISPGLIETMIPDLLSRRTNCIDDQTVFQMNQTIYQNLGPDPRAPLDGTRNQGLFPKCSSPGCVDDRFFAKNDLVYDYLHDQIFRAKIMLQLAEEVVNSVSEASC
ncbi:hypothetical protein TRFO_03580 [Tritrichomonas foetus]|uniref:Uncharacterized protein n=1 Tax=Tritrichomonas foetus TaxID=1144522 RepID=A0A1J4KMN8_9EUKA|nr:hypothetical protein TRFO_03580 [Tritrichomonas foetus]|eukprot:OHT12575.1 hypothetical protein TRFO_03580 [Tritrichomonas foetus]